MYTYIKQSISKHFVTFDEPLNPEEYNNIGENWQDYLDNKLVLLSSEQIAFHEENPTASVKEVWDMEVTPPHIRTLEEAKDEKRLEINTFDLSDNVNDFIVNGIIHAWLTPEERANYRNSIDAAKLLNIENVSLFIGNMSITIPTQTAELMLAQI